MLNFPPNVARHAIPARVTRSREFDQWTLATLVDIVWRRIGIVVTTIAVLLVLATTYLAIAPARYTATAALIPDTKRTPPTPAEVPLDSTIDPVVVESQVETLKSEKIALAVIGKLKLTEDPEFVPPDPDVVTRILSALGVVTLAPRTEAIKQRIAVANFGRMLKVLRVGRSYVTEIAFTSINPEKAAVIANEISEAYIQDQFGARFFNAERANAWMQQRIARVQQQAAEASRALEELRAASSVSLDANGKSTNERDMEQLLASLAVAKAETARMRKRLEDAQFVLNTAGQGSDLPDGAYLDALNNETLNKLSEQYRALLKQDPKPSSVDAEVSSADAGRNGRLAELRNAVWAEVHKAAEATKNELEVAAQHEATLMKRIALLSSHVEAERQQLANLREREISAQTYRSLYDTLQNRYARVSQFTQQQSLPVTEARVVTEATPPLAKSSPKTALILFLALCAGGTFGMGAAIGREYFDRRIRTPQQIEERLGIPCLGALPLVVNGTGKRRAGSPRFAVRAKKPDAEKLLPLRTDRWLADIAGDRVRAIKVAIDGGSRKGNGGGRRGVRQVVGITSPNAGEGKTTVALSVAMLMAQTGKSTLLIDGSLRDRTLTRSIAPAAAGGLVAALKEEAALTDQIVSHDLGFHVLGYVAEPALAHPSDLLSSPTMHMLIDRARKAYDCIILDLPPVLAHVDVLACAGLPDAFVLVADWERTSIDDIERTLVTCDMVAERLIGVIVNKSRPKVALSA